MEFWPTSISQWTYPGIISLIPKCIIRTNILNNWQNHNTGFLTGEYLSPHHHHHDNEWKTICILKKKMSVISATLKDLNDATLTVLIISQFNLPVWPLRIWMMIYFCKYNQVVAPAANAVPKMVSLLELRNPVLNMWCIVIHLLKVFFHHQKGR